VSSSDPPSFGTKGLIPLVALLDSAIIMVRHMFDQGDMDYVPILAIILSNLSSSIVVNSPEFAIETFPHLSTLNIERSNSPLSSGGSFSSSPRATKD
jgi:hypothetical protein